MRRIFNDCYYRGNNFKPSHKTNLRGTKVSFPCWYANRFLYLIYYDNSAKIWGWKCSFFVLVGQLVSAAVIDHFALFGSTGSPLTIVRTLGISVMALGVWITQQA